jgi:hypothetical protein
MALLETSGILSLLRVHDLGTEYGPPTDQINVEVVIQFEGQPTNAYGFQLRNDDEFPARRGMLDLLRDAFNNGHKVTIDYNIDQGKDNGTIIRTWLTHSTPVIKPVVTKPFLATGAAE